MPKNPVRLQTTTIWDYPSQAYSRKLEIHQRYRGATPAYIIWNLLYRYTKPKDLVVDPMCGSGTTLDVARELGRRALGYDIWVVRKDVFRADARNLPLENEKADFVFVDPPYSNHIRYSGLPECLGELSADTEAYYRAMGEVIREIHRILRPECYMAVYISDSYKTGKPLMPIGFRVFSMLSDYFIPVDIVSVVRHNVKLMKRHWHTAAVEHNYFLRGFHYLFIMYKPKGDELREPLKDRRDAGEIEFHLGSLKGGV